MKRIIIIITNLNISYTIMKPIEVTILLLALVAATLSNDLIPDCPDPRDGGILPKALESIAEALADAGEELPGIGKIFKGISIMLTALGGFDDELGIIIDEMMAYVNCEIAVAVQRQNSQQMVNDLVSYNDSLRVIQKGQFTNDRYVAQLNNFVINFKQEEFINPGEFQSNVEFLKYAIAIHLGTGLELMSACVHFNFSACLGFRNEWNDIYSRYIPYAESVVSKAVDWRLNFVKLSCSDSTTYCFCTCVPCRQNCPESCSCSYEAYYSDTFISTKKLHFAYEVCSKTDVCSTKDSALVTAYNGYRSQIQARMTKNFAQPISDWKAWYSKINTPCSMTVPHGKIILPANWDKNTVGMRRQLVCDSGSTFNVTCQWPNWIPKQSVCCSPEVGNGAKISKQGMLTCPVGFATPFKGPFRCTVSGYQPNPQCLKLCDSVLNSDYIIPLNFSNFYMVYLKQTGWNCAASTCADLACAYENGTEQHSRLAVMNTTEKLISVKQCLTYLNSTYFLYIAFGFPTYIGFKRSEHNNFNWIDSSSGKVIGPVTTNWYGGAPNGTDNCGGLGNPGNSIIVPFGHENDTYINFFNMNCNVFFTGICELY